MSNPELPLSVDEKRLLELRMGEVSVVDNLCNALGAGRLVQNPDGTLALPLKEKLAFFGTSEQRYYFSAPANSPVCCFHMGFVFGIAYANQQIPHVCKDCYKVKVAAKTMRQLMALVEFSRDFPCMSKVGSEVDNYGTPSAYAGYFYATGLDSARATYREIKRVLDEHPEFGPQLPVIIKRGCTEYEHRFGPSDKWTFSSESAVVEAVLEKLYGGRVRRTEPEQHTDQELDVYVKRWARDAYRIGDETYRAYIGDEPLHSPVVTYHD